MSPALRLYMTNALERQRLGLINSKPERNPEMQRILKALCQSFGILCHAAQLDAKIDLMSNRMTKIEHRIDGLESREKYWMPRDLIDVR